MTNTPINAPPTTLRRIADFLRFWWYLRANVTVVLANQGAIATALQNEVAILNQLNARVHWYERRVPLIAKEYAAFLHQQKKLIESAEAQQNYAEREAKRAAEMAVVAEGPDDTHRPKLKVVSR